LSVEQHRWHGHHPQQQANPPQHSYSNHPPQHATQPAPLWRQQQQAMQAQHLIAPLPPAEAALNSLAAGDIKASPGSSTAFRSLPHTPVDSAPPLA